MIPYTSVYRIIDEYHLQDYGGQFLYNEKACEMHYDSMILKYIHNYWINSKDSFTSRNIKHGIQFDLNLCINTNQIKKFLKNEYWLSFKRGASRPIAVDYSRSLLIKQLFAVEFAGLWNEEYLYINVNEMLFSNKKKQNYSWLSKDKPGKIHNMRWVGSSSLLLQFLQLENGLP